MWLAAMWLSYNLSAAHLDFGVYANQSGYQIIELIKHDDKQIFYIKKK